MDTKEPDRSPMVQLPGRTTQFCVSFSRGDSAFIRRQVKVLGLRGPSAFLQRLLSEARGARLPVVMEK